MTKYAIDENKPHLGGNFPNGDPATWCPSAWKFLIDKYQIKSAIDVGSGRGWEAKWFKEQGVETIAIEGLQENVDNAVHPTILIDLTEKYFENPVDFVNCIEVVEHIDEKYLNNLLTTICQGKYLLMTHAVPGQKGWHHVNCQPSEYWINHLSSRGYELLEDDSKTIQQLSAADGGKHIARNGMVFRRK